MAKTSIEWATDVWNPSTGCTEVSPGCGRCYAKPMSRRLKAMGQKKYAREFEYVEHEQDIGMPLKWKKPRKIFVNSMSDLFHEKSTFEFTMRCFLTMLKAPQHTYLILTKRPRRMAEFSELFAKYFGRDIPPHIWMGTSVESAGYTHRIDDLREVRCHTRFISFEPLLRAVGVVDLSDIHWAIIGGESGPNYRPVHEDWVRALIIECKWQRVPVFFKQWGGARPKSGGREIDGRTHDEYPAVKPDTNPIPTADIEGFDARRFAGMCPELAAREYVVKMAAPGAAAN